MIDLGKKNLLGVLVNAIDYEAAVEHILEAARARRGASITALAVHGVMTGVLDREQRYRLNQFDLVVPDGQPVRWALNLLHGTGLTERVYGPQLTLRVCERAAREGLAVFFYGSTKAVLDSMRTKLLKMFPKLEIAGTEPSKFRRLSDFEASSLARRIRDSGATIVFAGLGCPRQETWAYEFRDLIEAPILAVGAAFPFLAGELRQAPSVLQRHGLEWLFRLSMEPRRLWRRYVLLNPAYLTLLFMQLLGLHFDTVGQIPGVRMFFG